ncbi:hypothetical protein [Cupriavidus campinensis]|uniref:hypothetical protein n=1 Tax=Cupriavidus campinensis TaxID=151783 RepID=UPI00370986BE
MNRRAQFLEVLGIPAEWVPRRLAGAPVEAATLVEVEVDIEVATVAVAAVGAEAAAEIEASLPTPTAPRAS